ncbi:MAG: TetR/AcrR family transcriptional regulator [Phycisphaerae bacterium]|nr:TetR/AcrR family transcriptional regulator [Phycisphaerae bacterium]
MKRLPAAKRREQLLDCALELFARVGYARATTAQLAKMAGVTEPIIYRHFDSKRDLFVALITRTAKRTLQHWEDRLADAADPPERLRRILADNPMTHQGREAYRVLMQAITEVDDAEVQKAVARHFFELHKFITKELAAAQEERKLARVFSAELIAWVLIDIGLGYGVLEALRVPNQGEDRRGRSVRDVLDRMLVRRGPKRKGRAS